MSTLSLPIPTVVVGALPMSRSSSDSSSAPSPPRYSTLAGVLPRNISLNVANSTRRTPTTTQSRPPRYSSVFVETADARRQAGSNRHRQEDAESRQSDVRMRHEQESRYASRSVSLSGAHKFEYYLRNSSKSAPWATLRVFSKASATSSSMSLTGSPISKVPKFNDNEPLQGCLELNFDTPQNVNSIHLVLRGRVMTSAYDEGICTFMEYPITAWTRANGDPHTMLLTGDSRAKKFDGKLSGNYTWPFAFIFPSDVQLNGSQRTPPTFFDRKTMCSVQYDLVLKISHGLLRSDSKLNVNIAYAPDVMPPPPSILRQVANGERILAPGPDEDPVGWRTMAPVAIRGNLSNDKSVKLQCTVSLANPQSYVRGSIIPCHIAVYSKDSEALETLVQPNSVVLRLSRKLQYYEDGGQAAYRTSAPSTSRAEAQRIKPVEDVSFVGKAIWTTPSNMDEGFTSNPYMRELQGEIHLDKDMSPSCDFPLFKASYTVDLLPFDIAASKTSSSQASLGSWPVTIVTVHPEGPTPVAFTKPSRPTRRHERTTSAVDAHPALYNYSPI